MKDTYVYPAPSFEEIKASLINAVNDSDLDIKWTFAIEYLKTDGDSVKAFKIATSETNTMTAVQSGQRFARDPLVYAFMAIIRVYQRKLMAHSSEELACEMVAMAKNPKISPSLCLSYLRVAAELNGYIETKKTR
jgi:hypothetical protein